MSQDYLEERRMLNEDLFRIEGQRLQKLLHRSIGAITFNCININVGSGVLISKDIFLTAAHNIYDRSKKCEFNNFKVYIGAEGQAQPYSRIIGAKFPEQFKNCRNRQRQKYDYGVLKLERPVLQQEYLPLLLIDHSSGFPLSEVELNIYGYPAINDNFKSLDEYGEKIKLYQYGLTRKNRIQRIDPQRNEIAYNITTYQGESGCPVVMEGGIVGVHVGSNNQSEFNICRMVDSGFIDNIRKWCRELEGASFTVKGQKQQSNIFVQQIPQEQQDSPSDLLVFDPAITKLKIINKKIKEIDLRPYQYLLEINLPRNQLSQIDIRSFKQLNKLNLSRNNFESIDLSQNKELVTLTFDHNKLRQIVLLQNRKLVKLQVDKNQLEKLDISSNTLLEQLGCGQNNLRTIDLKRNIRLFRIRLCKNMLASIDLSQLSHLKYLELDNNHLSLVKLHVSAEVSDQLYFQFRLHSQDSLRCLIQLNHKGLKDKVRDIQNVWTAKLISKKNNNKCDYVISGVNL